MTIGLINTGLDEMSPPMNLAYLAAALKKAGFSRVKIIDHTFGKKRLREEVRGADIVGISAITKYYTGASRTAAHIKSVSNAPVIIGGVHISAAPGSLAPAFDAGVIGEGEETLVSLCKSILDKGGLSPEAMRDIRGLVYRHQDALVETYPAELIASLDDIPMPDFNLLDERYFRRRWINWTESNGRLMHITTSRGCPYNCLFCATKRFWQKTRFHSAQRMLEEIKALVSGWGIDHFVVDDDLFLTQRARLQEFADILERSGLAGKVAFSCNARSSLLDEQMCSVLKRIGVRSLNFGFESGNNRLLQYLKGQGITVRDHERAIELCNAYGIKVYGSLIFASPTETIEEMKDTLRFIDYTIEKKCHKIWAFVMTPLPGTPMWEIAKQRGKVSDDMDWDLLNLNSAENPMLLEPDIDIKEFRAIFARATALLDKAWLRSRWLKTVFLEYRRVLRRGFEDPRRACSILYNVIFKKNA